jgi:ABC-type transport system involved in multi-copper enzyme maturation permease subunit
MSALATHSISTDERRPAFSRLVNVELRKMVDTRSGFWLPIGVAAITLITVIISALVHGGHDATFAHLFRNSLMPSSFLLPVLGILLVCGEWTQRTTLATFTLIPDRGRVLSAKLAASLVFSVAAFIVCIAFSFVFAELVGNAPGGAGGISLAILAQGLLFVMTAMMIGVAFGAAILISAPGIVLYLLLPTVWNALAGAIHALQSIGDWLALGQTWSNLPQETLSGTQWAQVGTTLLLWLALPLAIGWYRFRTRDVN